MAAPTSLQDLAHSESWDYDSGSPHLTHPRLRAWMTNHIVGVVTDLLAERGEVRVLEVGAGHGSFTDTVLSVGAKVTVTEMSQASARFLSNKYRYNRNAHVVFDATGDGPLLDETGFDLVLCVSVLHHIPDYVAAIGNWADLVKPGGTFVSFQDPLYYPRQPSWLRITERLCYYLWRISRGELKSGVFSFLRRARKAYDVNNARDMVEYHVLRDGCDDLAIVAALETAYAQVDKHLYWSTQSPSMQRLGERLRLTSEFGVIATKRRG